MSCCWTKIFRGGLSVIVLGFAVSACMTGTANRGDLPSRKIDDLRLAKPELKVVTRRVPRDRYLQAVENQTTLRSIRLVPILKNAAGGTPIPEYRVFDIQPDSAYTLLGLENADILVAAEGFVVLEPEIFPQYVSLLREQQNARIEIRRANQPLVLDVQFVQ